MSPCFEFHPAVLNWGRKLTRAHCLHTLLARYRHNYSHSVCFLFLLIFQLPPCIENFAECEICAGFVFLALKVCKCPILIVRPVCGENVMRMIKKWVVGFEETVLLDGYARLNVTK